MLCPLEEQGAASRRNPDGCGGARIHLAGMFARAIPHILNCPDEAPQLAIIVTPTKRDSWLHRALPGRVSELMSDEEQGFSDPQRAIRYRDDLIAEVEDDEHEDRPQRAIDQGVQTGRNAVPGSNRGQEHLALDNAWART